MTGTRYPIEPLLAKTGDQTIYDLADRLGVSHQRIVELAAQGLTEKQVEHLVVAKLRIHPGNVMGWDWWRSPDLERFVHGATDVATSHRTGGT